MQAIFHKVIPQLTSVQLHAPSFEPSVSLLPEKITLAPLQPSPVNAIESVNRVPHF